MLYCSADRWRVALEGENPDYIHASVVHVRSPLQLPNFITGCMAIVVLFFSFLQGYKQQRAFIITQGPMQSTARDFWKMIHDRSCTVIVMLSDLVEKGQVQINLAFILC